MKRRIAAVLLALCMCIGLLPATALAANANAVATDGSGAVVATVEYEDPASLETYLTVRIFLNKELVGQTEQLATKRTANHVVVTPTNDGWYYKEYKFSEGYGTWDVGGTLTCHDSAVTLDVYYTSENLSTGTVYTLVERVDENADLQNGQSTIVGITATRTSLDTSRNGTVNVYVDEVRQESVSVTLETNSAWHLTLNYDQTKYSFDSFGKAGEGYYYATEDTLYAASFAPGDNFEWNIYFTSSSTGTQIVNGYLGEAELNDTFQIQEVPNPVSADVLPGGTATVRVYISDVLMYEDTSVQTRDGTNYYYLSFDTTAYELDLFKATRADGTDIARAESLSTLNSMYFHIPDGATIEIWLVPVESFAFDVERYEYLRSTNTGIINTDIADSVDISWTYNGHDFSYTVSGSAWTSFLLRLPRNTNITIRPNMNKDEGWVCWGWALPESLGTSAGLIDEEGNPENDSVEVGFIGALNPAGGDGTVTLVVRDEGIVATTVMLRLYGIDYSVADFEKELVTDSSHGATIPSDVTISFPDANGTVQVDAEDDTVTLLYRLTVTGQAGTSFTVTDEGATLVAQDGFSQSGNAITGTIPDGGVAQFYVYKEFTVTADTTVTNIATIAVNDDVPDDEDIAPGEEEDSEETPIDKEDPSDDPAANEIFVNVYLDGQKLETAAAIDEWITLSSGAAKVNSDPGASYSDGNGAEWNDEEKVYVFAYTAGDDTAPDSAFADITVALQSGVTDVVVQSIQGDVVYGGASDPAGVTGNYTMGNVNTSSNLYIYLNRLYNVEYDLPDTYVNTNNKFTDDATYVTYKNTATTDNSQLITSDHSAHEYCWVNPNTTDYSTAITLKTIEATDGLDGGYAEDNTTKYSGSTQIDLTKADVDISKLDANSDRTITFTAQETGSADITVTKAVTKVGDTAIPAGATQEDIPAALAGDEIEWTITVKNEGGSTQDKAVTITENLDGAVITNPQNTHVTVNDNVITVKGLEANESVTITVTYKVTADDVAKGTAIKNSVTVDDGDGDAPETVEPGEDVPVAEADILDVPTIYHSLDGVNFETSDGTTEEHLVTTTDPAISYQAVLDLSKMDLQNTSNTNQSVSFGSISQKIYDVMNSDPWGMLTNSMFGAWDWLEHSETTINLHVQFDAKLDVDAEDMAGVTLTSSYFKLDDTKLITTENGYWVIPCVARETRNGTSNEVVLSGITLNLTSDAQSTLSTSKELILISGGYIDGTVTFKEEHNLKPLSIYGEAADDVVNLALDANNDGTADKYQVTVNYTAGTGGSITDRTTEVLTIRDGNNQPATSGSVTATGSTATASAGYTFSSWTNNANVGTIYTATFTNAVIANATGGSIYTFTANFTSSGGTDPGTEPDPDPNPGDDDPDEARLHFNSRGGTEFKDEVRDDPFRYNPYDKIPSRPGYRFTGWYDSSRLDNRYDEDEEIYVPLGSKTVFAGWEETTVPSMLNGDDHYAYIQGYADGSVRPNANITRAQVATIFFRLLDEDVRDDYLTTYNTFPDVDEDYWANTAISTMASLGVINGRNSGLFDPDAYITRAEFAAICARFDDSGVSGITTFTDTVGHWAEDEISRAAALGWIQGYADGTFRPNQYITRAQAVTMINRVLCRLPETEDDLLTGMNTWTDCHVTDWFYLAIQEATNSHDFVAKDRVYESWTDLNRDPDWSRYE